MVARLGPGSPAPRNPDEVELLLRMVPKLAYFPELHALLPAPLPPGPLSPRAVAEGAEPQWLLRVVDALWALEQRASDHDDGGLRFLAVTLRHFLQEQRIDPAEHPLVVALFVRTAARRGELPDHPAHVARVLDGW
ncbi:hypothetical protein [Paraliomyxa miuraensis]|uniref:hypothetical protein n=1 Tax=Paraliomyxa miuraensis TaxID=376150 RepID=UPI0022593A55|nr:hypothetical protein [Paraliomyxa miuraensis]MCX4244247.1 hypothetical protein [Paraliomyxa miuraensis]